MKHHEDCDQHQATLHSEGPYGDPSIEPTDYACYCPKPEPKRVTITIESPDEDGDYRVSIVAEGKQVDVVKYGSELAEILPTSKEVTTWLR